MSNVILFPVVPRRIPIHSPADLARACAFAARTGAKVSLPVEDGENIRILPVVRIEREGE